MQQAEAWGHRPENSNPCKGIRRYRQVRSERFLSPEEYRRLAEVLERHEAERPQHAAAVRLLLLTGCRKSEILTLEWRFYREGRLYLPDSKTGPRTVWLCATARDVLDRLPRSPRWIFPAGGQRAPWMWLERFWRQVRSEAGLEDVRLHDMRHSYASMALLSGETIRTVGRLLGHEKASTTLKYAHLSDTTVKQAVDALAAGSRRGADMTGTTRRVRLTDAGVRRLRPARTDYVVWDSQMARVGRPRAPVGASQLCLARTCERLSGAGNDRFGGA